MKFTWAGGTSAAGSSREISGTYVQIDRARKLVFIWIGPLTNNVNTLVTVELNLRGDETDLVLTHERLPTSAIVEGHTRAGDIFWIIWRMRLQDICETQASGVTVYIHPSPLIMHAPP